jgi:methylated-DNA-protein-cysteine methyltransferase-like protein
MAPGDIFGGAGIQRMLLESEGIAFLPSGRIDLRAHIFDYKETAL